MEKEFVTYELALRLKALGFDEPCFGAFYDDGKLFIHWNDNVDADELFISQEKCEYYDYECLAPTWQQAFRWFRRPENGSYNHLDFMYACLKDDSITYEEAELECLKKLIEIVENEKML